MGVAVAMATSGMAGCSGYCESQWGTSAHAEPGGESSLLRVRFEGDLDLKGAKTRRVLRDASSIVLQKGGLLVGEEEPGCKQGGQEGLEGIRQMRL
jgi:hypothetical protein